MKKNRTGVLKKIAAALTALCLTAAGSGTLRIDASADNTDVDYTVKSSTYTKTYTWHRADDAQDWADMNALIEAQEFVPVMLVCKNPSDSSKLMAVQGLNGDDKKITNIKFRAFWFASNYSYGDMDWENLMYPVSELSGSDFPDSFTTEGCTGLYIRMSFPGIYSFYDCKSNSDGSSTFDESRQIRCTRGQNQDYCSSILWTDWPLTLITEGSTGYNLTGRSQYHDHLTTDYGFTFADMNNGLYRVCCGGYEHNRYYYHNYLSVVTPGYHFGTSSNKNITTSGWLFMSFESDLRKDRSLTSDSSAIDTTRNSTENITTEFAVYYGIQGVDVRYVEETDADGNTTVVKVGGLSDSDMQLIYDKDGNYIKGDITSRNAHNNVCTVKNTMISVVPYGQTLTIEDGGALIVERGAILCVNGTIVNYGLILVQPGGMIVNVSKSYEGTIDDEGGDLVLREGGFVKIGTLKHIRGLVDIRQGAQLACGNLYFAEGSTMCLYDITGLNTSSGLFRTGVCDANDVWYSSIADMGSKFHAYKTTEQKYGGTCYKGN